MSSQQGVICQICNQRPATLHLCQVQADGTAHLHICGHCVRGLGLDLSSNPPDVPTVLAAAGHSKSPAGLAINLMPGAPRPRGTAADLRCRSCGLTLTAFKRLNRFGCPACLDAFGLVIEDSLQALHGATRHLGRQPRSNAQDAEVILLQRQQLHRDLETALAEEAFERAALLRDQLQALDADAGEAP